MDQFFLTLPSNSSMSIYPGNKTSHYRTRLPSSIELHGDYEVALVEASFPFTFSHFGNSQESVKCVFLNGQSVEFPWTGLYHYTTDADLVYKLNDGLDIPVYFGINKDGYVAVGYSGRPLGPKPTSKSRRLFWEYDVSHVVLSPLLAETLGFTQRKVPLLTIAQRTVNRLMALPQTLFYYCDLVESQRVGDTLAPLLRTVNTKAGHCLYGSTCTESYTNPFYIPVLKKCFADVEILIKDDTGHNPSFTHGTSSCVLHFRRRSREQ